jgi:hypothetical protein
MSVGGIAINTHNYKSAAFQKFFQQGKVTTKNKNPVVQILILLQLDTAIVGQRTLDQYLFMSF